MWKGDFVVYVFAKVNLATYCSMYILNKFQHM